MGVASACYFSELFLSWWSGCKSSMSLDVALDSPSSSCLLTPPPHPKHQTTAVGAAEAGSLPLAPSSLVSSSSGDCDSQPTALPPLPSRPGSSWQCERTFNNEENIIAFIWLKPSSDFFPSTWDASQTLHFSLQGLSLLTASFPEA